MRGWRSPLCSMTMSLLTPLAALLLGADGLAELDVLVADHAGLFRQDRVDVRVVGDQHVAGLDLLLVLDGQVRAVGDLVALEFLAALGVLDGDLAVALEDDHRLVAVEVLGLDGVEAVVADDAAGAGLDVVLDQGPGGDAAGVERPHRELRARLADALGGDDAGGQALLDELAGAHVHAVALGAHAHRVVARQRAADAHGLQAQALELRRQLGGDDLVLARRRPRRR